MHRPMTLSEKMAYSTVRIETDNGTGTGFFFSFCTGQTDFQVPAIVTNKHVIKNCNLGRFILTAADEHLNPIDTQHHICEFSGFEQMWIMHPDQDVDLCALPIAAIFNKLQAEKKLFFFAPLDFAMVPTEELLASLNHIEDIIMVGYPTGLSDEVNNMPIFRKGITSTHPRKSWKGKKEILVDVACFPGSSGSPIFLYNEGAYTTGNRNVVIGAPRRYLLAILYAGPQHTAQGEIVMVPIATKSKPIAVMSIPINLGVAIKSERLRELDSVITELVRGSGELPAGHL